MSGRNFLYSQVFNFGNLSKGGVDARTGLYGCNIELYEVAAQALNCPSLKLSLRYNSLNLQDIGFGQGWALNLSSYSRNLKTLVLSTGEHFQVAEAGSSLTVIDQKLRNFQLKKGDSNYQLIHKNGQVEILSYNNNKFNAAVPIEVYAANGRSLQLSWAQVGEQTRLQTVQQGSQVLLNIKYADFKIEITRAPGTTETSTLTLVRNNNKLLDQLQLPLENSAWNFTYKKFGQITCLVKVKNPAGLVEEIRYNDKGHRLPNKGPYHNIPCVSQHTVRPGNSQPPIVTKYGYSDRNFLAYDGVADWKHDEDNLYRIDTDYQYSTSVQIVGGRQTKYTYNQLHLLIGTQQQQGKNLINQDIEYHALNGTSFQNQPAKYQLPKKIQTAYVDANGSSRTEVSEYAFDDWGNILQEVEPSGIRIDRIYFPASGEEGHCPADPNGFERYIKSELITPALAVTSAPNPNQALTRNVTYKHCELPTASKAFAGYFVAIREIQGMEGRQKLISAEYTYVNQKDQRDHGRLQQQIVRLQGKYDTKYNWTYSNPSTNQLKKTTQVTTFDKNTMHNDTILSTYTGLTLSQTDRDGIERSIQYDRVGRITLEMVSPGKKLYEVVMKNEYAITESSAGYCITTTDFQGLQTRQHTDGLGRICRIERQDDFDGVCGPFRIIQERKYNEIGQCINIDNVDWLKVNEKTTEQHYEQKMKYDDWGHINKVTDNSGMVILSRINPVSMTHTGGIQGESQTKIEFNELGVASQKLLLKSDGKIYNKIEYTYDGMGRLIQKTDNSGNITEYQPDKFGRLIRTTWSDGRKISTQYAAHSTSALPISTKVGDCTVATQTFDGACRIISHSLGTCTTKMYYKGNEPNPVGITTSQGDKFDFSYDSALDYAVTSSKSKDEVDTYQYDKRSSAILSLRGSYVTEQREYLPSGLLMSENIRIESRKFSTQSTYSMAGKLKTYTDVHGQMLDIQYDDCGRPKQVIQGKARATFAYDKGNRLSERCAYDDDKKRSLKTSLKYDEFGRETERIVRTGTNLLYQLIQTYNEMNLITSRNLKDSKGKLLRGENFEYDQRYRLVDYKYQGVQPMLDEAGQKIQRQQFSFDMYDNLTKIMNTFQDGSQNTQSHIYSPEDPTRLVKITNLHKKYAAEIALEYDGNGCLVRDEQGRKLQYDTKGRLSIVSDAKDKVLSQYYYDASSKLVCQKAYGVDTYLHYRGDKLVALTSGDQKISFLSDGKTHWGQTSIQKNGSSQICLWASDRHQSLLAWFDTQKPNNVKQQQYTPYGYGAADFLGFNGQWRDSVTGWYHLGNGYRVYNPVLMRFHSPDRWSPFLSREISPYVYCLNDPVNHVDPTGHIAVFGIPASGGDSDISSRLLGPLQVTVAEGPLLNPPEGHPPWWGQIAYFDSINGVQGLQGLMTHGDTHGRLLGRKNIVSQNGAVTGGLWGDTAANVAKETILPTITDNMRNNPGFLWKQLGKPIYLFSCNGADPISFRGQELASTGQRVANELNQDVVAFHGELRVLDEFKSANIGMIHNVLKSDGGVERVYGHNRAQRFKPEKRW